MTRAEDCTFEEGVYRAYPDLKRRLSKSGEPFGIWYSVVIRPYRFEPRKVDALVPLREEEPWVLADGPTDSPHRYYVTGKGFVRLCMWYPQDPPRARWRYFDGLLALLGHARTHLIREGFYREEWARHGRATWLGPEAPHEGSPLKRLPEEQKWSLSGLSR